MTQSSVLSPQSSAFPGWPPGFQEALERLAVAARRPAAGHEPGMVRSRVRGRALEFADHRPYVAGDDPRLVDWRAYARLDRLYLKQYDEERSRTLTLLVDVSASLDWGIGEAHKGAYARRLAAALAWIGVSGHEPVRVFLLRDGAPLALPPVSTRTEAIDLFRRLAAVQEQGATRLDGALRGVVAGLAGRARGPVVLLSDLLDPGWEDALRAVAALGAGGAPAAAGDGAVVQVLAPDEWEPPLGEEVELEDAETSEVRPSRLGPAELASYRARLEEFIAQVRDTCRRLGLLHVALNSGVPLQQSVLRTLPAAGVLR